MARTHPMLQKLTGDNGTLSYLVAASGYWLPAEDHLGEKISPIYTTHRWWVTKLTCNKVSKSTRSAYSTITMKSNIFTCPITNDSNEMITMTNNFFQFVSKTLDNVLQMILNNNLSMQLLPISFPLRALYRETTYMPIMSFKKECHISTCMQNAETPKDECKILMQKMTRHQ